MPWCCATDHESQAFVSVKVRLLEEARAALLAAGIEARSCDGRDRSLDEEIAFQRESLARGTRARGGCPSTTRCGAHCGTGAHSRPTPTTAAFSTSPRGTASRRNRMRACSRPSSRHGRRSAARNACGPRTSSVSERARRCRPEAPRDQSGRARGPVLPSARGRSGREGRDDVVAGARPRAGRGHHRVPARQLHGPPHPRRRLPRPRSPRDQACGGRLPHRRPGRRHPRRRRPLLAPGGADPEGPRWPGIRPAAACSSICSSPSSPPQCSAPCSTT